jgi:hypothetical protein
MKVHFIYYTFINNFNLLSKSNKVNFDKNQNPKPKSTIFDFFYLIIYTTI